MSESASPRSMERTVSEKQLFFLNQKSISHQSQNQDHFLYGTIRKLPQKGTVRVLADKYDKCSRTPITSVKSVDTQRVAMTIDKGTSVNSLKNVWKMNIDSTVKFSNSTRDEGTKEPKTPINEIRLNNSDCYSLEAKPSIYKGAQESSERNLYEKIYGNNYRPLPEIVANLASTSASNDRQRISSSKAKDDIAAMPSLNYSIDVTISSPALQPKPSRVKLIDNFDSKSDKNPCPSLKPSSIASFDEKLYALSGRSVKKAESKSKPVEGGETDGAYGEPVAVDWSKSDKVESDDEDASYFHVLLLKNQDNFSTVPNAFKTPPESTPIIPARRSTYKPLPEQNKPPNDQNDSLEKTSIPKRRYMLNNIINSEKNYVALLEVISQYKSSFEKSLGSSLYLSPDDVDVLFKDCQLLLEKHRTIVKSFSTLEGQLSIRNDISIGKFILDLAISEFEIGKRYLNSYPEAVKLLQRLMGNGAQFRELIKNVCLTSLADVKLEDLLFKPIFQLQKNISMWTDLLSVTPEDHQDYKALVEVSKLSESFLIQINSGPAKANGERILKEGILVEKGSKSKKLVKLFLFKEVLICTKEKISNGLNISRIVRWYIPLYHLKLENDIEREDSGSSAMKHESELNDLQQELLRLQLEHQLELENTGNVDNRSLFVQSLINRKVISLQKKIEKQEVLLSLSLPILPLVVTNTLTRKSYHLLISSQYDQTQWIEAILDALNKAPNSSKLSLADITSMVNANKFAPLKAHNIEQSEPKDCLTGNLNIIIHKIVGLKEKSRVSCAIETDFRGHFLMKEQTNAVEGKEPEWNESFDVDLDGVKTLRILVYKKGKVDVLLGRCSLELDREWLSDNATFQNIMLNNELQLLVSLKFSPHQNMRRKIITPHPGGMFGVSLKKITKREGVLVPSIIKYCVAEVESRGMVELGLYRVSGLVTEVNKIKTSFDAGDMEKSLDFLKRADVNVVTSLLKLFLRSLPEALFTDSRYDDFMCALEVTNEEKQSELFVNLFRGLPACNSASIIYILKHILRVSAMSQFNKMSVENLATIFGPTLLRPSIPDTSETCEHKKIARETYCITRQANVLLFYLRNIQYLSKSKWQVLDRHNFELL